MFFQIIDGFHKTQLSKGRLNLDEIHLRRVVPLTGLVKESSLIRLAVEFSVLAVYSRKSPPAAVASGSLTLRLAADLLVSAGK